MNGLYIYIFSLLVNVLQTQIIPCMEHATQAVNAAPKVNVLRMLPKLLRTQPYIVTNQGITMAPLFLSLTS